MSSPQQRRETPRRPIARGRVSRMHPGWEVFMLAWFSGMFTAWTMVYVIIHFDWGFSFGGVIALVLFWVGGRKAEGLRDDQSL